MRKVVLVAGFIALAAALPGRVQAQQVPGDTSEIARYVMYQDQRVSPTLAVVLDYLLTPLGHAYAHNWRKGIWPSIATYGGVMLAGAAADGSERCTDRGESDCSSYDDLAMTGIAIAIAGKLWGMISAHHAADAYNAGLKQRLRLAAGLSAGRAQLGLALSLP